ncbi:MAG: dicarboxylate/amino acid:cation symporter [Terriglobia bacterium]
MKLKLHNQILLGLVLGAVFGAGVRELAPFLPLLARVPGIIEPVGTLFIRLITMVVIPLVFASLVLGIASIGDVTRLARIGGKTLGYYIVTTALAVTIGLVFANAVRPGSRLDESVQQELLQEYQPSEGKLPERKPIKDMIVEMVPRNPLAAAAQGDMLPVIVFALLFGLALSALERDRTRSLLGFLDGLNGAMIVIVNWVMKLAPYAVFALIAVVVARFGTGVLRSLLLYVLVVVGGLVVHLLGILGIALALFARVNPWRFLKRSVEVASMAFATSSSSATLPVTMRCSTERHGISPEITSFVLPLGATMNMNGTALYQGVAAAFIAEVYGMELTLFEQLEIVLTATLAAVGAAGVPGAGIITLILVLQSVGIPIEGIALILGVDRILDMCRTAVNVMGDLTAAAFIARTEGEQLVDQQPARAPASS